jgi:pimeloyl-ACP methyl ester carboxylesterase
MKWIKRVLITLVLLILLGILFLIILFGHRDIPLDTLKEKYANEQSAFISVDGMDVHFRDEGNPSDSIPVVLIHGTGSSLHTFDGWTRELTNHGRRVIRMDLPAYGLTGPFPERDYSISSYVSFIHSFLSAIDIDRFILGGNSLGGGIAWNVAVSHPNLVSKLILIDASGYPSEAKSMPIAFRMSRIPVLKNLFKYVTPRSVAQSSLENVYVDKTKVSEELVDRYWELTLRPGNREAFIDRLSSQYQDNHTAIKSITQPTLILWGHQDLLIPEEMAYRFQEDLPNDTLVIMSEVGHVPMEEQPNESIMPVLYFLGH